jgi:hypothetical protein
MIVDINTTGHGATFSSIHIFNVATSLCPPERINEIRKTANTLLAINFSYFPIIFHILL